MGKFQIKTIKEEKNVMSNFKNCDQKLYIWQLNKEM